MSKLKNIPHSKRGGLKEDELKVKEREYLAYRLVKWKNDEKVMTAEKEMYRINPVQRKLSFCIAIQPLRQSVDVMKMLESVWRQEYEKYKIYLYQKDGEFSNLEVDSKLKEKL